MLLTITILLVLYLIPVLTGILVIRHIRYYTDRKEKTVIMIHCVIPVWNWIFVLFPSRGIVRSMYRIRKNTFKLKYHELIFFCKTSVKKFFRRSYNFVFRDRHYRVSKKDRLKIDPFDEERWNEF